MPPTYIEDDTRWHRSYLGFGTLLLLIRCSIEVAHDGLEDDEVIGMVRTQCAEGNAWE